MVPLAVANLDTSIVAAPPPLPPRHYYEDVEFTTTPGLEMDENAAYGIVIARC